MRLLFDVPLIPQSQVGSCWAASIAMIVCWRQRVSAPDEVTLDVPGGAQYRFSMAAGLDPNDRYVLEMNGFALEDPTCFSRERVASIMRHHGPLWVATAMPSAHIRVVRGLTGTTLHINDPWPVGRGSQYTRNFSEFFGRMERLGTREMRQPAPIYLAHLR